MERRYKLKAKLLPAIVIVLLVMQLIDPSRIWTTLLVGFGGAWVIAFLWARSLANSIHLVREVRYGWAQVGDKLEERFTLKNDGALPATWLEILDRSTIPGYSASIATGVDPQSSSQWVTAGTCKRRGLFWLGDTLVRTGDPLGIYEVEITDPARTNLMVMPPVVPLPQIQISPGGFLGEGRPQPNSPEHTVGASSVREYVPGDSLKTVHWRSSARHEKLYVRLFDGAPAGDWWILVDLDKEKQVGIQEDSTEEHAIVLAASLADKGLRARQAVGLVASADHLVWLSPRSGENQRWDILRALATVELGSIPLEEVLERIRPNLSRRSSLLLITSNMEAGWLSSLTKLSWQGIVPTIILLNSASFGGGRSSSAVSAALDGMSITNYVINRGMLDSPEAKPGHRGQWEWRISATGRAVPIQMPGDSSWRRLAG